jgi:hypothetical protein
MTGAILRSETVDEFDCESNHYAFTGKGFIQVSPRLLDLWDGKTTSLHSPPLKETFLIPQ